MGTWFPLNIKVRRTARDSILPDCPEPVRLSAVKVCSMSDEKKDLARPGEAVVGALSPSAKPVDRVDPSLATTEISFCPRLGIYHYKRADGSEYFFDDTQLESSIKTYQDLGDTQSADFMAQLTAWARQFPHKLVIFYPDETFKVIDLSVKKTSGESEGEDQGGSEKPSPTST